MTTNPTPLQLARALTVMSGGPLLLALGSAVAPVAAVRRWPARCRRPGARRTAWAVTGAGGTHVALRAVRADAIWSAIDNLGVTNLCGAPTV